MNRSGYYKRLTRKDKPNRYEQDRVILDSIIHYVNNYAFDIWLFIK